MNEFVLWITINVIKCRILLFISIEDITKKPEYLYFIGQVLKLKTKKW